MWRRMPCCAQVVGAALRVGEIASSCGVGEPVCAGLLQGAVAQPRTPTMYVPNALFSMKSTRKCLMSPTS